MVGELISRLDLLNTWNVVLDLKAWKRSAAETAKESWWYKEGYKKSRHRQFLSMSGSSEDFITRKTLREKLPVTSFYQVSTGGVSIPGQQLKEGNWGVKGDERKRSKDVLLLEMKCFLIRFGIILGKVFRWRKIFWKKYYSSIKKIWLFRTSLTYQMCLVKYIQLQMHFERKWMNVIECGWIYFF